jgi:hypothetical protein
MARKGTFDKLLEPLAWFDENARPEGWFSDELLTEAAGGSYTLVADGGTYSYSGNNANLLFNRLLSADGATYSYAGNNANLTYTPVGSYTLAADGGTYTYSGNNANLRYNRILVADGGTYSYSGNNANLTYAPAAPKVLVAEGGVYSYGGNNANLVFQGGVTRASGGWVRPVKLVYDKKRRKEDEEQLEQAVIEALPAVTDTPESRERRAEIVRSLIRGEKPKIAEKERPSIDLTAIRAEIARQKAILEAEERERRLAYIRQADDEWLMAL